MNYCSFSIDTNGATGKSRLVSSTSRIAPGLEGVEIRTDAAVVTLHIDQAAVALTIASAFLELASSLSSKMLMATTP